MKRAIMRSTCEATTTGVQEGKMTKDDGDDGGDGGDKTGLTGVTGVTGLIGDDWGNFLVIWGAFGTFWDILGQQGDFKG